jgi:uncharacterized protein (DUF2141 family)
MKNHFLASAMLCAAAARAGAADLSVEIHALKPHGGPVVVALYRDPLDFPIPEKRLAVQTSEGESNTARVVFHDIAPGRYAVAAFQDSNRNGKLDKNLFGVPTEPYGFSRDARGRMGPPSFEAAAFEVTLDSEAIITLR